jgi:hypothetical protein
MGNSRQKGASEEESRPLEISTGPDTQQGVSPIARTPIVHNKNLKTTPPIHLEDDEASSDEIPTKDSTENKESTQVPEPHATTMGQGSSEKDLLLQQEAAPGVSEGLSATDSSDTDEWIEEMIYDEDAVRPLSKRISTTSRASESSIDIQSRPSVASTTSADFMSSSSDGFVNPLLLDEDQMKDGIGHWSLKIDMDDYRNSLSRSDSDSLTAPELEVLGEESMTTFEDSEHNMPTSLTLDSEPIDGSSSRHAVEELPDQYEQVLFATLQNLDREKQEAAAEGIRIENAYEADEQEYTDEDELSEENVASSSEEIIELSEEFDEMVELSGSSSET